MRKDKRGYTWCINTKGRPARFLAPDFIMSKSLMAETGYVIYEPEKPVEVVAEVAAQETIKVFQENLKANQPKPVMAPKPEEEKSEIITIDSDLTNEDGEKSFEYLMPDSDDGFPYEEVKEPLSVADLENLNVAEMKDPIVEYATGKIVGEKPREKNIVYDAPETTKNIPVKKVKPKKKRKYTKKIKPSVTNGN